MLWLRRIVRRTSGNFWALWYWFTDWLKWIRYAWILQRAGSSATYVRNAFWYLAQLDIDEFWKTPDGLQLRAYGLEVHVKDIVPTMTVTNVDQEKKVISVTGGQDELVYEFVMFQDHDGRLVVHEWRKEPREVALIGTKKTKTHWYEVFREGRQVDSVKFLEYLKKLYGAGLDPHKKKEQRAQAPGTGDFGGSD